jgi:hypothetical protein
MRYRPGGNTYLVIVVFSSIVMVAGSTLSI